MTGDDPQSFVNRTLNDDAEIKRLAKLSPLNYQRERKAAAEGLRCRVTVLDGLVEAERTKSAPQNADTKQGRPIQISETELWAEEVEGAAVLDASKKEILNYVLVTDVQADAIALWAMYTHVFDAFDVSPKLIFSSPTKRCGKTRLIEILSRVVARPLATSGIRPAALLRLVEMHHPSLLLDEMDTILKGDKEMAEALRGLANSGFDRGTARYIMNVPTKDGGYEPREFSTWCPQVWSGIGNAPDTVRDRSIEIIMQRKPLGTKVSRLRRKDGGGLAIIASKQARWADDNMATLQDARPEMPESLQDRAADAWEPLFAIADLAGGDWPQRALKAALALSGGGAIDDENIGSMLLADIREIFVDRGEQNVTSADLTEALSAMKDRPWADWRNGKAITQNALARLLKPYTVVPMTIRTGLGPKDTAKGYKLESFKDSFECYLPPPSDPNRHTVTTAAGRGFHDDSEPSQPDPVLRFEKCVKANNGGHCDGVTVENARSGRNAGLPFVITVDMRRRLRERGFGEAAIHQMTPETAWRLLDGEGIWPGTGTEL